MYLQLAAAIFVAVIFYIIAVPFIIIVYLLNSVARAIVTCVARWRESELVTLMQNGMDSMFTHLHRGNSAMIFVALSTERSNADVRKMAYRFENEVLQQEKITVSPGICGQVLSEFHPYNKLRYIVTSYGGYSAWRRDKMFNVERHFRNVHDPERVYKEEDLMILLKHLSAGKESSKPQWEFVRIPKFEDSAGQKLSVTLLSIHHSYVDGLSLLKMLQSTGICTNDKLLLDPICAKPVDWMKKANYWKTFLFLPYHQLIRLKLNTSLLLKGSGAEPATVVSDGSFYNRTSSISTDVFKRLRQRTNATIPNLVLLAFTVAVRRVFPPCEERTRLRFGEIAAILPYENSNPQNRFTVATFDVKANVQIETLDQLRDASDKLRGVKKRSLSYPEPLSLYYSALFFGKLPKFCHPPFANSVVTTAYLSNIPSFANGITLFNTPVRGISIWPPIQNERGPMLASVSYSNQVTITAHVDPECMSADELHQICIQMEKVINELDQLVSASEHQAKEKTQVNISMPD